MKTVAWIVLFGMLMPWGWILSYLGVVGAVGGFVYQCLSWLGVIGIMAFAKCNRVI